jgi:hypothetical protein
VAQERRDQKRHLHHVAVHGSSLGFLAWNKAFARTLRRNRDLGFLR